MKTQRWKAGVTGVVAQQVVVLGRRLALESLSRREALWAEASQEG
jgi:hypothetical protein